MFPLWCAEWHPSLSGNSRSWQTRVDGCRYGRKRIRKELKKTDVCNMIQRPFLCGYFLFAFLVIFMGFLFHFNLILALPFSTHPQALSYSHSPFLSLHPSLTLFTQLGLMEQWPNDEDPGEQTHLDSPPAATTRHIHTSNATALSLIPNDETN